MTNRILPIFGAGLNPNDYYTKEEINQLLSQQSGFTVVSSLPTTGDPTKIYLLGPTGSGADQYEEWIYSNDTWVKIGDTTMDLSGYQTLLSTTNKLNADYVADGTTNKVFTATEQGKLANIAAGAEVNVQANWNESDTSSDAYIQNKPTIPAAQVNSDWNASSGVAEILNKPNLATVATTGAYSDLSGTPTIPDDLNDLTDVNVSSPSNGQVLKYNSTSQKWENGTGGGGGNVVELTQQQYDALVTPDPDTTYIITDADAIDMDDYALVSDIATLTAGKADKQNVTANTNAMKFPHWNADGVITGSGTTAYAKTLTLNNFSAYYFLSHNSNNWPSIWAPVTSGTAGQILKSNGSGGQAAPTWVNIETLTGGLKFWLGTQAQYDALAPNYDSSTLYVIQD